MIQACKTASARKVTAVIPCFPYSRQPDVPYKRSGAPLTRAPPMTVPSTPHDTVPSTPKEQASNVNNYENTLADAIEHMRLKGPWNEAPTQPDANGYRQWVARSGTLVAELLMCAGKLGLGNGLHTVNAMV